MTQIDRLLGIMQRLRDPQTGCPWDKEQTYATIAPYTLEETYEVLDAILHGYVEEDRSVEELIGAGFDRATVERIARLVIINEYKRRQAAPGVRITPRAFGRDRRYPITSGFRR